jgi:hypothetical protein
MPAHRNRGEAALPATPKTLAPERRAAAAGRCRPRHSRGTLKDGRCRPQPCGSVISPKPTALQLAEALQPIGPLTATLNR